MAESEADVARAHEELVVAHRLFQRYEHRDTAWLVEFLVREWRRVLGPEEAYALSRRARLDARRLEESDAPLAGGTVARPERRGGT